MTELNKAVEEAIRQLHKRSHFGYVHLEHANDILEGLYQQGYGRGYSLGPSRRVVDSLADTMRRMGEALEEIASQKGEDFQKSFYHMRDVACDVLAELKGEGK